MNCVHDPCEKGDRIMLAVLVAITVLIAGNQAYRAGERSGYNKAQLDLANARLEGQAAGWNACLEQF